MQKKCEQQIESIFACAFSFKPSDNGDFFRKKIVANFLVIKGGYFLFQCIVFNTNVN